MTLLFHELKEKLISLDELTLLELLEISSEELVNAFEDKIDQNYEKLLEVVE